MKPRTTLILLGVFVALAAGYWLMLRAGEEMDRRAFERRRLFQFDAAELQRLTIHREETRPLTAARQEDGTWRIVEPVEVSANQALWDRVADRFATFQNERTIREQADGVEAYGVSDPVLTVTGETRAGARHRLVFGLQDPTETYRYAQLDDGAVFLAGADGFEELNRNARELRDTSLFQLDGEAIAVLEFVQWRVVERADGERETEESVTIRFERDGEQGWKLTQPFELPAEPELVEPLVNALANEQGKVYIDTPESFEDYGLDPPGARILVWTSSSAQPQELHLGNANQRDGTIYCRRAGTESVFSVDGYLIGLLPRSPTAFRLRRLLTQGTAGLEQIQFRTPEGRFALTDTGEAGWKLTEPVERETDQVAVSHWISAIKELEGRAFPGPEIPRHGLERPRLEITFAYNDGKAPGRIRLGAPDPETGMVYVTQDEGTVTTLSEQDVAAYIAKTPFDFQDRRLVRFAPAAVYQLELEFDGTQYLFERAAGNRWRIRQPEGKRWDSPSDMLALLDAINPVRANALEAESAGGLAQYGLDAPLARLRVALRDPATGGESFRGPLRIGSPAPDNSQERFAIVEGDARVYRIRQAVVDDIRAALTGIRDI